MSNLPETAIDRLKSDVNTFLSMHADIRMRTEDALATIIAPKLIGLVLENPGATLEYTFSNNGETIKKFVKLPNSFGSITTDGFTQESTNTSETLKIRFTPFDIARVMASCIGVHASTFSCRIIDQFADLDDPDPTNPDADDVWREIE